MESQSLQPQQARKYGLWILCALGVIALGVAFMSWKQAHDDSLLAKARDEMRQQEIKLLREQISYRDEQTAKQVAQYEKLIKEVKTVPQVVREIPRVVELPAQPRVVSETPLPDAPSLTRAEIKEGDVVLPKESAKPLFDRLAVCKEQELQLRACAENNQALQQIAEKEKATAEDYKKAAKGGGFWKRLRSNGKAVAIGIGIGVAVGAFVSRK